MSTVPSKGLPFFFSKQGPTLYVDLIDCCGEDKGGLRPFLFKVGQHQFDDKEITSVMEDLISCLKQWLLIKNQKY